MKKNIGYNTLFEIIARMLNFLITMIVSRFFGASVLGIITSAQALSAYITLFGDFGTSNEAIRTIAKENRKVSESLTLVLYYRLFFLVFVILVLTILFLLNIFDGFVIILFVVVAILNLFIPNYIFIGVKKFQYNGLINIFNSGFSTLIFGLGILIFDTYYVLPFALIIASILSLIISFIILNRENINIAVKIINYNKFKEFIKKSYYIGATSIFGRIYYDFDIVLLAFMTSDRTVGLYSAAFKIIQILWFIPQMYVTYALPIVTSFIEESHIKLTKFLSKILSYAFLLNGLIIVISIGYSNDIISLIFGKGFEGAGSVFSLLLLAFTLQLLKIIFGNALVAFREEKFLLRLSILGTLINIIGNFILIPRIGIYGAAFSTVLTELVLLICESIKTNRLVEINYKWNNLLKIFFVTIFTVYFSNLIDLNFFIEFPLIVIIYIFLLLVMKEQVVIDLIYFKRKRSD